MLNYKAKVFVGELAIVIFVIYYLIYFPNMKAFTRIIPNKSQYSATGLFSDIKFNVLETGEHARTEIARI